MYYSSIESPTIKEESCQVPIIPLWRTNLVWDVCRSCSIIGLTRIGGNSCTFGKRGMQRSNVLSVGKGSVAMAKMHTHNFTRFSIENQSCNCDYCTCTCGESFPSEQVNVLVNLSSHSAMMDHIIGPLQVITGRRKLLSICDLLLLYTVRNVHFQFYEYLLKL